jgi:hypothetical protein
MKEERKQQVRKKMLLNEYEPVVQNDEFFLAEKGL